MELRRHLAAASEKLAEAPLSLPAEVARLEAEILMAHALGVERSYLYAHPALEPDAAATGRFRALLRRRCRGEPIAHLTGEREFWSLTLRVNDRVLIPRPETELLVEAALERLPDDAAVRVADLGTGSGAIALALASERPRAEIHATEASADALALARANAARLGLARVRFHQGSWCAPLEGPFDLIVSNPPYVAEDDPHLRSGDLRFEPRAALTPGPDALAAIRTIVSEAAALLRNGGWLLLEHGAEQGPGVRKLLKANGYVNVATRRDLEGRERVTFGRWLGG